LVVPPELAVTVAWRGERLRTSASQGPDRHPAPTPRPGRIRDRGAPGRGRRRSRDVAATTYGLVLAAVAVLCWRGGGCSRGWCSGVRLEVTDGTVESPARRCRPTPPGPAAARVQNVTKEAGPVSRAFGLASITVHSPARTRPTSRCLTHRRGGRSPAHRVLPAALIAMNLPLARGPQPGEWSRADPRTPLTALPAAARRLVRARDDGRCEPQTARAAIEGLIKAAVGRGRVVVRYSPVGPRRRRRLLACRPVVHKRPTSASTASRTSR
jgi:hypothetical protein